MPRKNNNKKKSKRKERAPKAISCEGCSVRLQGDNFVYCVCTRVKFCSSSCQNDHPHKDCPGPPETDIDMGKMLDNLRKEGKLIEGDVGIRQDCELEETVKKPMLDYLLSKGIQNAGKYTTAWDFAKLADEGTSLGNQAFAYLAGSRFRHRTLSEASIGRSGKCTVKNRKEDDIPVLESQQLAFKYFEKAAKLGHGLAMQSLGTCFHDGVGCKENRRRCNEWLWRSCLQNSVGAFELIDGKTQLPLEINAQLNFLDQSQLQFLPRGCTIPMYSPNLTPLFWAFKDTLIKENFTLPPFAGSIPTATVGNIPTAENHSPRVPFIGGNVARTLCKKIQLIKSQGFDITFRYGRRGTCKSATAQTYGSASREVDNQIYFIPPFSACDESFQSTDYDHCVNQTNKFPKLEITCVHTEKSQNHKTNALFCTECKKEAIERLDAVARGSLILSTDEEIAQRGASAVYRKADGSIKTETWRFYSRGEAECILATIAASGMSPYVTPFFIAQDPNFFYPLIADHGCIRAALEYVAPHIDWDDHLGPVKYNEKEQEPMVSGSRPGKFIRKCGNPFCNNLEDYREKGFLACSVCNRRFYCSEECHNADWSVHKLECKNSAKGKAPDPRLDDMTTDGLNGNNDTAKSQQLKHNTGVKTGEDYVVHGLKAKPEYNGQVALAEKSLANGRYSVTLRSGKNLAIKPQNLHHIGVFCRKRKKKSRVFECVHGLQVCDSCYLDFTTVNRLTELKYNKQDMTSTHAVEQVNEMYFSSFDFHGDGESFISGKIECEGMEKHEKQRFILNALLEANVPMTLNAEVAKTAYVTYGAKKLNILRAHTRLEEVAQLL